MSAPHQTDPTDSTDLTDPIGSPSHGLKTSIFCPRSA
jgi:hypothetical protein